MNAHKRIRAAMLQNERDVVAFAKKHGKLNYGRCGLRWMKAIDRAVAKGRLRYSRRVGGYVVRKRRAD